MMPFPPNGPHNDDESVPDAVVEQQPEVIQRQIAERPPMPSLVPSASEGNLIIGLAESERIIRETEDIVRGHIQQCLIGCEQDIGDCRDCLVGAINRGLERVEGLIGTLEPPIRMRMVNLLSEAYQLQAQLGFEFPSLETVYAELGLMDPDDSVLADMPVPHPAEPRVGDDEPMDISSLPGGSGAERPENCCKIHFPTGEVIEIPRDECPRAGDKDWLWKYIQPWMIRTNQCDLVQFANIEVETCEGLRMKPVGFQNKVFADCRVMIPPGTTPPSWGYYIGPGPNPPRVPTLPAPTIPPPPTPIPAPIPPQQPPQHCINVTAPQCPPPPVIPAPIINVTVPKQEPPIVNVDCGDTKPQVDVDVTVEEGDKEILFEIAENAGPYDPIKIRGCTSQNIDFRLHSRYDIYLNKKTKPNVIYAVKSEAPRLNKTDEKLCDVTNAKQLIECLDKAPETAYWIGYIGDSADCRILLTVRDPVEPALPPSARGKTDEDEPIEKLMSSLLTGNLPSWGNDDICEVMEAIRTKTKGASGVDVAHMLGFTKKGDTVTPPKWLKDWTAKLYPVGGAIDSLVYQLALFIEAEIKLWPKSKDCDPSIAYPGILAKIILGVIERWSGADLMPIRRGVDYWINSTCQSLLPTSAEADNAFLKDTIDKATWACWRMANGDHIGPAWKTVWANRAIPSVHETEMLYRRGEMSDETYRQYMRANGVLHDNDRSFLSALHNWIPGPSDLIRFMLRDADDAKIVEMFELDSEFEEKFRPQLQHWAKSQGVSETVMKYFWRSHWQSISVTQLAEMVRRLRPGKLGLDEELFVTEEMADAEMSKNDIPSFWRKRLLAIQFRPMTRIDAQRAFFIGELDEEGLQSALQDQGTEESAAKILVKFYGQLKRQRIHNNRWIRSFRSGGLTEAETRERLHKEGLENRYIDDGIDAAKLEQKAKSRLACAKAVKRRFMAHEIPYDAVIAKLQGLGYSQAEANDRGDLWRCERDAKGKELSLANIKQLVGQRLLDSDQARRRLREIGFSSADTILLLRGMGFELDAVEWDADEANEKKLAAPRSRNGKRGAAKKDNGK